MIAGLSFPSCFQRVSESVSIDFFIETLIYKVFMIYKRLWKRKQRRFIRNNFIMNEAQQRCVNVFLDPFPGFVSGYGFCWAYSVNTIFDYLEYAALGNDCYVVIIGKILLFDHLVSFLCKHSAITSAVQTAAEYSESSGSQYCTGRHPP